LLQNFQLPAPALHERPTFQGLVDWMGTYFDRLYRYFNAWEGDLIKQFNSLFNGYGADIASASSITVDAAVHNVTGTAAVKTILQPAGQTAVSPCTLYSHDGFSLASGGNISAALAVPAGLAVTLAYHPALKLWLVPV
jgi:hypothetical protein